MTVLEQIRSPQDLAALTQTQLTRLAKDVRAFLITNVSRTGGLSGYPSRAESVHDIVESSQIGRAPCRERV